MNRSFRLCRHIAILAAVLVPSLTSAVALAADDGSRPATVAPKDHEILSETLGGWYFAPKQLKHSYNATVAKLESLQADLDPGRRSAAEAKATLSELKTRLESLRKELEASKVHVAGAKIHEQTETVEIDLGPVRRLAITANQVRVVGWEGPKVKCELKKVVLTHDDKPVDVAMKAIKIAHSRGRAEWAGQTAAEVEADEKAYLAGDGAKLTPEQIANRRKLVDSIAQYRSFYRDYQGKEVDQISIEGMDYQDNPVLTLSVQSPGSGGTMSSVRSRYAVLTVYVPTCEGVCIRGAMRGLSVEKLAAPLLIDSEGYTDENRRGTFEVRGLAGSLAARNMPLKTIRDVSGSIDLTYTMVLDDGRGGTLHEGGMRNMYPGHVAAVEVENIAGSVKLWFGRADLLLRDIGGAIDVRNEFGNTRLVATKPLAAVAHRLVTESGRVDVELSKEAAAAVPIVAVTNYGGIKTNLPQSGFDDFHLVVSKDQGAGARRNWSGFRTKGKDEDQFATLALAERFLAILDNSQRTPGLDIISRGGSIVLTSK